MKRQNNMFCRYPVVRETDRWVVCVCVCVDRKARVCVWAENSCQPCQFTAWVIVCVQTVSLRGVQHTLEWGLMCAASQEPFSPGRLRSVEGTAWCPISARRGVLSWQSPDGNFAGGLCHPGPKRAACRSWRSGKMAPASNQPTLFPNCIPCAKAACFFGEDFCPRFAPHTRPKPTISALLYKMCCD